jgi:hypothetical protein
LKKRTGLEIREKEWNSDWREGWERVRKKDGKNYWKKGQGKRSAIERLEMGLEVVEFSLLILAIPLPYWVDYCFGLLQLVKNSKPRTFTKSFKIFLITKILSFSLC